LKTQVQAFLDCVRTGSKPVVDGEQGLRALELAERVVQALEVPGDLS
jgi:predicted dehydrogenase